MTSASGGAFEAVVSFVPHVSISLIGSGQRDHALQRRAEGGVAISSRCTDSASVRAFHDHCDVRLHDDEGPSGGSAPRATLVSALGERANRVYSVTVDDSIARAVSVRPTKTMRRRARRTAALGCAHTRRWSSTRRAPPSPSSATVHDAGSSWPPRRGRPPGRCADSRTSIPGRSTCSATRTSLVDRPSTPFVEGRQGHDRRLSGPWWPTAWAAQWLSPPARRRASCARDAVRA